MRNNSETFTPPQESPETGNPTEEKGRDELSARTLRFLNKINANEIFCDEQHTRDFINSLEFESFKNLLLATNAVLRDIPIQQRSADGENVYLTGGSVDGEYIPPKFEDKNALLLETFEAAKRMNSEGVPLEDVAILLSSCINAIHLFNDANGRTSRLTYSLIKSGYDGKEDDVQHIKIVLGEYGRSAIDVNPGVIQTDLNATIFTRFIGVNPKDPLVPTYFWGRAGLLKKELRESLLTRDDLSEDDKKFLTDLIWSDEGRQLGSGFIAVAKILSQKGQLLNHTQTFFEDDKPVRSPLLIGEAIEELGASDIAEIRKTYWQIKKMYVETLISSIEMPEEFQTVDGHRTIFSELKDAVNKSMI